MNTITPIFRPSWNLSQRDEDSGIDPGRQTRMIIFSVVGIVGGAIWLFFYLRGVNRPSAASIAPFAALGQVTAEETAKLLGNQGRIIVVTRDPSQYAVVAVLEEQLKTFQRTIAKQPGLTVVATEKIHFNPDVSGTDQGLSSDDYSSLLQKYSGADAIVSFAGPPILSAQQIRALPQKIPKFIAVSLAGAAMKRLFRSDVIQVAIVNRIGPAPPSSKEPASTRERFDQRFQVVTADNANSLPY